MVIFQFGKTLHSSIAGQTICNHVPFFVGISIQKTDYIDSVFHVFVYLPAGES